MALAELQDEPATTANKLPFEQWLSQQTGTIDVECGCVMTEVFFHWLRVAYEAGNSPVTPDGWKLVPVEPNGDMLAAAQDAYGETDGDIASTLRAAMLAAAPQLPGSEPATVPGKWIPVNERMPEIRKGWLDLPVIIAVRGEKDGAEAMYCLDGKFRWGRDEQPIDDVTHWMPLPAAPQEVK
ncbi:DUF551 domain-containing protein [Klebsiella michiganensis]|nr:DUF551 domain-containing protein [Klebsiella michiganensis]ELC2231944.1 DUF551 domain-containing protein [Klebsiella michiganensis]ELJ6253908.1 DUF551 domain-containing protein [Klebsiella michiganensis]